MVKFADLEDQNKEERRVQKLKQEQQKQQMKDMIEVTYQEVIQSIDQRISDLMKEEEFNKVIVVKMEK